MRAHHSRSRSGGLRKMLLAGVLVVGPLGASAETRAERTSDDAVGAAATTGSVAADRGARDPDLAIPGSSIGDADKPGLDALLQLPTGYGTRSTAETVAGAGETEWRRRFRETTSALSAARAALEQTKRELDRTAGDSGNTQWNVAPPTGGGDGQSPGTSPLSFKLRQALRENRLALDAAKRSLRALEIEANLAGVPQDWRGEPLDSTAHTPSEVGQLLD